eukprot:Nk52_evm16s356 gene=Nk52_evmTU16s356
MSGSVVGGRAGGGEGGRVGNRNSGDPSQSTYYQNLSIKVEHQVNSFGVDCTGQYAVLAARKGLFILDLEAPEKPSKTLPHNSKWEVTDVQWSPHKECSTLIATTSNQKALIWNISSEKYPLQNVLHTHTRAITDLQWSWLDKNLLATCSQDSHIHIWDIRDPRKPATSMHTYSHVSQVKWNKHNERILASSQGGEVTVWDMRNPQKQNQPINHITAHWNKIYGLDWSPKSEQLLVTCSQDKCVKVWNVDAPRLPQATLQASDPVWRSRYTPFGEGLVTLLVPNNQEVSNSASLWDFHNLREPVHVFKGHTDNIKEFDWRIGSDDRYQLVTWSKDQTLRLWSIDEDLKRRLGHMPARIRTISAGSSGGMVSAKYSTSYEDRVETNFNTPKIQNLGQELSLVNLRVPNVLVEELSTQKRRSCSVVAKCDQMTVRLVITFPPGYPNQVVPIFEIVHGTSVSSKLKMEIKELLRTEAAKHVESFRSCLEPCMRALVKRLEDLNAEGPSYDDIDDNAGTLDENIPFPRFCGATFSGCGKLVTFCAFSYGKITNEEKGRTPRSYDMQHEYFADSQRNALTYSSSIYRPSQNSFHEETYGSLSDDEQFDNLYSIDSHFYSSQPISMRSRTESTSRMGRSSRPPQKRVSAIPFCLTGFPDCNTQVHIRLLSKCLPFNPQLAYLYKVEGQSQHEICVHNMKAAQSFFRKDLADAWEMMTLITDTTIIPKFASKEFQFTNPWFQHPFARPLVKNLLGYFSSMKDVQTLAALACVVLQPLVLESSKLFHIHNAKFLDPMDHQERANLSKKSGQEHLLFENTLVDKEEAGKLHAYILAYAELLHRWGLLNARQEVLKFVPQWNWRDITSMLGKECKECASDVILGSDTLTTTKNGFGSIHFAQQGVVANVRTLKGKVAV